ncbi:ABC-F family ATP-binding cassette domain-containing protein [Limibacter armeniacum]|uniref:ABC-F family ATP-binding cassette domain-containing protein n=1 Tax=Limibacter armeniacum TaxID=466084 RepID=UPI002FE6BF3C
MNFLSAENISKSYGDKKLFENISFGLEQGQKVALVAKNGSGKTTLLDIITGKDTPDTGSVAVNNNINVAYLSQDPTFNESETVLEHVLKSDSPILRTVRRYEEVLDRQLTDTSGKALKDLEKVTAEMEELKAWDAEARIKQILGVLKIENLHQKIKELSGGQRKRIAMAKVLIDEPDLLIMDEPTNHLDLDMIEWLEQYLVRAKLSLLLVTHDRYFLDRICDEILELSDGTMYRHKGNYSYYIEKKAERESMEAASVDKAKNLMRKELDWVRRMPKARGTKAKYRMDAFDDLKEKATSGKREDKLQLSVKMSRMGKKIMELKNLDKSYGDKKILDDFNYIFKRKERIGIVGKNGVGKSTFLNILTGKDSLDKGEIEYGETVVFGYYSQQGIELTEDKRVIDVVKDVAEVIPMADGNNLTASQLLQRFNFPPEQQYAYVSTLSGGERKRLYLCEVLMDNPNFLILDEPTNDLDLQTLSILEDFLEEFPGCLLVVTHDRYFMDKLVDHLFVFEGEGKVTDFNGKYTDYRDIQEEKEAEEKRLEKERKKQEKEEKPVAPKAEQKRKRSYKEQKEYEQLETDIEQLEAEKEELNNKLNGSVTDHAELMQISQKIGEIIDLIDEKMMRWLELDELNG